MTTDNDLDVMNIIRDMPDDEAAFYFRFSDDDGFYYYTGHIEALADGLKALMEQDEAVLRIVADAINEFT